MEICLLVLIGIQACISVYQQKQIKTLKEQMCMSLEAIWRKLGFGEEDV